jgi:hypothetical protein
MATCRSNWCFALVRRTAPFDMAEFFVMRKYERRGIGRQAAIDLFHRFPGPWQVRQQQTNPLATSFWRSVIPYPFKERRTSEEAGHYVGPVPKRGRPPPVALYAGRLARKCRVPVRVFSGV